MSKPLRTREYRLEELHTEHQTTPAFHHLRYGTQFVTGQGSMKPLIVFVTDIPSAYEAGTGVVMSGPERVVAEALLYSHGLKPEHAYFTTLLKYRPCKGRDPRPSEAEVALDYLWDELEILKPLVVVLLGRFTSSVFFEHNTFHSMLGVLVANEEDDYAFLATHSFGTALSSVQCRKEQIAHLQNIHPALN